MVRPARLAAVVVAVLAVFLVAAPAASAAPNDACRNGGYANYVDPSTGAPFKNQGQCVSYVAGGGTLTQVTVLVLTFDQGTFTVTGSGLLPGADILLCNTSTGCNQLFGTVNQDGTASISRFLGCGLAGVLTYLRSTTAAGEVIESEAVSQSC